MLAGEVAAPEPSLSDADYLALHACYSVGKVVGAYWKRPLNFDFEWFLRPVPDPRPFSFNDLALITHAIDSGGAVLVLATEQAALDIALAAIEAESVAGHA